LTRENVLIYVIICNLYLSGTAACRSGHLTVNKLIVPRCRLNTYGGRVFSIAGPTVWNSLLDELRDPAFGSDSFQQFLKTIMFSLY